LDSYSRSVFARAEKDAQASTQYCSYVVRQQQPSNANLIIKESRGKNLPSGVGRRFFKLETAARACVFFDLRHRGGLGARAPLVRAARRPAGWSRRLRAGYGTRNHDDGFFSTVLVAASTSLYGGDTDRPRPVPAGRCAHASETMENRIGARDGGVPVRLQTMNV